MDFCKINGRTYDVLVTAISETFDILFSDNTGRNVGIGASMVLDPLGAFFSHKVTFRRKKGKEAEYDELFDFLATPRYDGFEVEIAHGQSILEYRAYVGKGERKLKRIDEQSNKIYWDEMSISFVPMEAQVTP